MSIRHYDSITDIRRTLKKIAQDIKQHIKTVDTYKQGTKLASSILKLPITKIQSRIEIKAIDMMSLSRRTESLAALTSIDNVLTHLLALIENELPDEFIVQKLRKEITNFKQQIELINSSSDYSTIIDLPIEFESTYNRCLKWLQKHLVTYSMISSRVILSSDSSSLYFNAYVHITDLVDKDGYVYKDYYFVIRQSNKGHVAVGISHSYKSPETINYIFTKKPLAFMNRNLTLNKII